MAKNFTPRAQLAAEEAAANVAPPDEATGRPNLAQPAPSTQMPPQARTVQRQVAPVPSGRPEAQADATDGEGNGPSPDELAAIAARRAGAPQTGDQKMSVPGRAGWVRRWVNDTPGRVQRFISKGWNFVKNPETGENWLLVVNSSISKDGGLKGYVMEIPLMFYSEDQQAKKESLDLLDKAIYGGTLNEEPDDKRYVPKETMKFSDQTGPGSG